MRQSDAKAKKAAGIPGSSKKRIRKKEKEGFHIRYLRKGKIYYPIKVGDERDVFQGEEAVCIDCGAKKGEQHRPGCDYEVCPRCGHYLMNCRCGPIYEIEDGATDEEINAVIGPSASGSNQGTS